MSALASPVHRDAEHEAASSLAAMASSPAHPRTRGQDRDALASHLAAGRSHAHTPQPAGGSGSPCGGPSAGANSGPPIGHTRRPSSSQRGSQPLVDRDDFGLDLDLDAVSLPSSPSMRIRSVTKKKENTPVSAASGSLTRLRAVTTPSTPSRTTLVPSHTLHARRAKTQTYSNTPDHDSPPMSSYLSLSPSPDDSGGRENSYSSTPGPRESSATPTPGRTTRGRKLKALTRDQLLDLPGDEQDKVLSYSVKFQAKAATLFRAKANPNCHQINTKTILKPCNTCNSQDWPCVLQVDNPFGLRKHVSRCVGCRHTRSTCTLKQQVKEWARDDPRLPWELEHPETTTEGEAADSSTAAAAVAPSPGHSLRSSPATHGATPLELLLGGHPVINGFLSRIWHELPKLKPASAAAIMELYRAEVEHPPPTSEPDGRRSTPPRPVDPHHRDPPAASRYHDHLLGYRHAPALRDRYPRPTRTRTGLDNFTYKPHEYRQDEHSYAAPRRAPSFGDGDRRTPSFTHSEATSRMPSFTYSEHDGGAPNLRTPQVDPVLEAEGLGSWNRGAEVQPLDLDLDSTPKGTTAEAKASTRRQPISVPEICTECPSPELRAQSLVPVPVLAPEPAQFLPRPDLKRAASYSDLDQPPDPRDTVVGGYRHKRARLGHDQPRSVLLPRRGVSPRSLSDPAPTWHFQEDDRAAPGSPSEGHLATSSYGRGRGPFWRHRAMAPSKSS